MRILIVDDSIDKITELSKLILAVFEEAYIETSENITNTMLTLNQDERFNLIIIDLLLPLRTHEMPKKDGGKQLLNDIYRKKDSIKIPDYIVGITQSEETNLEFSNIWSVLRFSHTSGEWRLAFSQLLNHIKYTQNFAHQTNSDNLPTIFVEGLTDKFYLEKALEIFFSEHITKLKIISQKNAGANWVATQIPLWAMRLQTNDKGDYIKALGLLDSDEAGNTAKLNIDKRNLTENEKKCCGIYQLRPNHNPELIIFFQNKCKIEIEIESLFSTAIMKFADEKGWMEYRAQTFTEAPNDWRQHEETSIQYITRKEIPTDNLVYIKKIRLEKKQTFCKYVGELENEKETFKNFKPLLGELLTKLNILKS